MNTLDFAPTTAAERAIPSILYYLKPDFSRAQFSKDGIVHTEARCNQCGFRIGATSPDGFDYEEQEHARSCRGSEVE